MAKQIDTSMPLTHSANYLFTDNDSVFWAIKCIQNVLTFFLYILDYSNFLIKSRRNSSLPKSAQLYFVILSQAWINCKNENCKINTIAEYVCLINGCMTNYIQDVFSKGADSSVPKIPPGCFGRQGKSYSYLSNRHGPL